MSEEIAIVGIGNPYRGDDGAGWAVIDALQGNLPVPLLKQRGDIAALLDLFSRYPTLILIDACTAPTGSWFRINALKEPLPPDNRQTSTHGLNLSQAIELAKTMDQLPANLILYAICGENFQINAPLSHNVARTIPIVAHEIIQEMKTCTKKASPIT